jgi:hypothetical protein
VTLSKGKAPDNCLLRRPGFLLPLLFLIFEAFKRRENSVPLSGRIKANQIIWGIFLTAHPLPHQNRAPTALYKD